MQLTDLEKSVLLSFNVNYESAEDEKMDNASFTSVADIVETTELDTTTVKGVVGSLTKKGLISAYKDGSFSSLILENEGIDLFFDLVESLDDDLNMSDWIPDDDQENQLLQELYNIRHTGKI